MNERNHIQLVEDAAMRGLYDYFWRQRFHQTFPTILTRASGACEQPHTLFGVDYFGDRVFLRQTAQLSLEADVSALGRVWCAGSSFRAEKLADGRHLTEFPLVEFEFSDDEPDLLNPLLEHVTGLVHAAVDSVLKHAHDSLVELKVDIRRLELPNRFPRITYTEAIGELRSFGLQWGDDLGATHEQALVREAGGVPLFVTHYPKAIKFFNMRVSRSDPDVVNSADLLLPFAGEAAGCAEREFDRQELVPRLFASSMWKELERLGVQPEDVAWYVNGRDGDRPAMRPHAGGGIGFSRLVQYVLGQTDIRQATSFLANRENLV